MDLPDRKDLFGVGRRFIRTKANEQNLKINPLLVDVPGSNLNLIVGTSSVMAEALSAAWARCARGLLVSTARGDELDRIAFDRFGITRKPANQAGVLLTLSRSTGALAAGVVNAGARAQTAAGTVFSLDVDVSFGAGQLLATVPATATTPGPDANVPQGSISTWVDPPFDPAIGVTNAAGAAGGTLEEDDPTFRGRIRGFFLTVRRATAFAVQYGATLVPGVAVATAFEIENPGTALPAAAGELIVGDKDGGASPQMLQAVIDEELNWRPIGIPIFVSGGVVVRVPVTYSLSFEAGVDTVAAAAEVRAVAVAVAQFLRPGQTLSRFQLNQAPGAVPGVIVRDSTLAAPLGDVEPPDNKTILRVFPEDVSFA